MKKLRFVIFGINGTYNYGCEAIVRGTTSIIMRRYPNSTIKYISLNYVDDVKRLKGCPIRIIKQRYIFYKRLIRYLLNKLQLLKNYEFDLINWDWIKKGDVFLSVGGDVYNLLSNERFQQNTPYFNQRITLGQKISKSGKKLVIWGASIGPFEENLVAKELFFNHFKNDINMITARESNTDQYLRTNGIKYHRLYADPAFAIEGQVKTNFKDVLTIGINLSPLSLKYCYDTENEKELLIQEQSKKIEEIIRTYNADIIFIPHVISKTNENDDDLRYLKKVLNYMRNYKNRVKLIKNDPGFIGIKETILKCDIMISARMHCAINAISVAVPTIFIGYSDKASGMCSFVYGDKKYYIDLKDFVKNNTTLEHIIKNKHQVNNYLRKRLCELRDNAFEAANSIAEILNE